VSAHPISVARNGQLANSPSPVLQVVGEPLPEGLDGVKNASLFLIQTNKSGGFGASQEEKSSYNENDSTSVPRESDPPGGDGIAGLAGRLERCAAKAGRSKLMGEWITSQPRWRNFFPVGRRVAACGSYLLFHDYWRKDQIRLMSANFCANALLCPFCATLRGARHMGKAIQKIQSVMAAEPGLVPYLWTGTIKDESTCGKMHKRIKGLLAKVLQSRRDSKKVSHRYSCWSKFHGGIVSFEVKRGSGSQLWHIHFHAIVLSQPGLDPDEFKRAWSDVVGYWAQSDLRPLRSTQLLVERPGEDATKDALAKDLQEVFKYAVKCSDMVPEDNFEAFRQLKGRRLISAFGSLFGLKFADDDIADDGIENEPYRKLLFDFVSSGPKPFYQLQSVKVVRPEDPVRRYRETIDGVTTEKII
jgi:hypothetical protein